MGGGIAAAVAIAAIEIAGVGGPDVLSSGTVARVNPHFVVQTGVTAPIVGVTSAQAMEDMLRVHFRDALTKVRSLSSETPTTLVPPTTTPPTTIPVKQAPAHLPAAHAPVKPDPATTTTTAPVTVAATPGLSSMNWSGYVLASGGYQEVSAEWTVPALDCAVVPNGSTSDWVGVNGWVDPSDLFQAGTESTCAGGAQSNSAVWSDGALGFAWQDQFTVSAGDLIDAEVQQSAAGTWTATVSDLTSGQSATASETVVFAGSSAEWVAEDSGAQGSSVLAPLADFGSVTFSNVSASPQSVLAYSDAIEMLRANGSTAALPSQIAGTGLFTVSYEPQS